MTDAEKVERLVQIAPKVIQQAYVRGRSVITEECGVLSRLCYDTLAHLGIKSDPLDCYATAWNAHFNTWLKNGGDYPAKAHRHSNDPRVFRRMGHSVPSDLKTHAVVYVPSIKQIVDLAAWQLSHPREGIQIPGAICLPWDGEKALFESPNGWVGYRLWDTTVLDEPVTPFFVRHEWIKWRTQQWLAKLLAKKVTR